MTLTDTPIQLAIKPPIKLGSKEFINNQRAYYAWLLENTRVVEAKVSLINTYAVSRYDDCVDLLKDPRFVRNRTTATGGSRMPIPMPKSVQLMAESMIVEDDPEHRRLRNLVHKAFTPRALAKLETRIESLTNELLDSAEAQGTVDLKTAYALPIPVTVIKEMMGVPDEDMDTFSSGLHALTNGMSGFNIMRTLMWDLPKTVTFSRELIARKRQQPGDDILTGLIQAEEDGDALTEDELIAMIFLLIFAGFETTVHLIGNSVVTLLTHPDQLARLRAEPDLLDSAVEEVVRFDGPVLGTKMAYAVEDTMLHGTLIPKGKAVVPILGAANHDPRVFENPNQFDIARTPNRHLGFGQGIHYCLGAPLARMETRIALKNLLERNPNLALAVDSAELKREKMPLWNRYESVPVRLG